MTAWNVIASAESLGGIGACGHTILSDGYSELSTNPNGPLDFAALGHIPCGTQLRITNPANGRAVITAKQDVGAGSSFLPVMGLYPGTVSKLGLSGGEFHVTIERTDGGALHPVRGTSTGSPGGVVTPTGQAVSNVGLPGLEDAIDTSSAMETMFPGAGKGAARAHEGYQRSHDTWYRIRGLSVFTKNGGH